MNSYLILLRGINVGGKNKISMTQLSQLLKEEGFKNVATYIQSGNVLVQSNLDVISLREKFETLLSKKFQLDSQIRVLVLTHNQLKDVIDNKPKGFGEKPNIYHSDVMFLLDINSNQVLSVFSPKEGVDRIWPGNGVIYSQRLSSQRSKSRLNKIIGTIFYKSMTIRNWNTTTKLLKMIEEFDTNK